MALISELMLMYDYLMLWM